jgi:hypothetical protein
MNDEVTDLVTHGGWFIAGLTTLWAFVLRWIVGRHLKQFDSVNVKLESIDMRLSIIEGRFTERDRNGRYRTKPGDYR